MRANAPKTAQDPPKPLKIHTVFDLCTPRREVLRGRVAEADFAADLAAVLREDAPADYREPARFFENTHPTRGLKRLLENVCRRLSGAGGEAAAIFRLDTSFGGGKTHGLIALAHAARHPAAVPDEFLDPALRPAGPVRVAAFDGENAEPANGRRLADGVTPKTPWGEIAWALAGRAGFDRVRASDEQGVAPGAETIRDLFGGEPTLILLDELAVYLRKVKRAAQKDAAGQLTAFLSVLFKAVETAPNAALVFTLALGKEGAVDAYREENQWIADRMAELGSVAARKATLLNPTEEDETAPVLRRRLFEHIDESRVDEVAAAYRAVWKTHAKDGELSREGQFPETVERFRAGYPFHPELLDTLTRKVSTLNDFQRVRGMLRLLTRTVAHLWKARPADAGAIHLHHVPVGSGAISSELITRLGQKALEPALNADVGGKSRSLAEEIDDELHHGLPPYAAYAARTIFLHTLAFNEPLRGCSARRLRYSMVGPGTDFAYIEETRKRFLQDSAYLDDRPGAPLRFLAEANLNKIIRTREGMVDPGDARAEIHDRIRGIFGSGKGGKPEFEVVPFPGGPSDIPDDASERPRLVVLSPDAVGIGSDSDPVPALLRRLHERKGADDKELRFRRNHLVFLAAEAARKETLRQRAVRRLALAELKKPVHLDDLAEHQRTMVGELEKKSQTDLALAVQQCYRRLFVPARAGAPGGSLESLPLDDYDASEKPGNGQKAVVRALREKGKLRLPEDQPDAPEYVRDKTPLKTKGEMTTEALRDEFRQNPALPMLIGDQVFVRGVRLGIEQGRFVYRRGDFLFGPDDPADAKIVVDGESTVSTVQYAKNIGIWPRPAPKPEPEPDPTPDPTPDRHRGGKGRTGEDRSGGGRPHRQSDEDRRERPPGVWSGSAEGPMGEALARVREQAQQAGVSLGSLTIRPQEWGDALRLLKAAGTARLGAETTVELEGGYETRDGSSYCMQEFHGTVADAGPVVDFLEPQCRDATSVNLKIHLRLTFPGGFPPTGEGWEKLAGKLGRWVIGAAVLSAESPEAKS